MLGLAAYEAGGQALVFVVLVAVYALPLPLAREEVGAHARLLAEEQHVQVHVILLGYPGQAVDGRVCLAGLYLQVVFQGGVADSRHLLGGYVERVSQSAQALAYLLD